MNDVRPLDRQTAETYAAWFKALADGTRVQVVSLLARSGRPLTVREIVAAVPVGQSTVSEHLRQLVCSQVRAGRGAGYQPPVPDQRELRGLLPDRRGPGDGQALTRPPAAPPIPGRMIMTPHRRDDREQVRAAVGARYAGLARAAQARARQVTDCDPGRCAAGSFGPAAYPDAGGVPEGAVRASLGCGNPVAVADLRSGETVLDLGCGAGLDVLLSARRVGPSGKAYGLDMTGEMLDLARAHAEQAGAANAEFLLRPDRGDPAAGRLRRRDHLQLRDQPVGRPDRGLR